MSTHFPIRLPHLTVLLLGLSGQVLADPHDGAHETLRTITVRAESADQALGMATEAYEDARRWDGLDMPAALLDRCPPSEVLAGPWQAAWWYVDSRAGLREGTLAPWNRSGDEERGIAGVELGATGGIHWGVLEAHVGADVLGAVGPLGAAVRLDTLRIGTRLPGFHAGFSLRDRWVGPGRLGSLIFTDNAAPLPAVEVGGTWTFPGRAQVLGRFGTEVAVGWIPEASRRGVERPGWLLLDLRWQPLPWIEVGLTRNAMFGGKGRPVDVGQLILPTSPHVEGDPDRLLPDTDERAAVDLRVTLPLARWGAPLDYLEFTLQHGGEDIIARRAGPIPVPSLAGVANLYGFETSAFGFFVGAEHTVIEDDVFRWYRAHRVYHDGWSYRGRVAGHAQGGDSRSWSLRVGMARSPWVVEGRLRRLVRVGVADLLEDTLFVFPERERSWNTSLRGGYLLPRAGAIEVEAELERTDGTSFIPGQSRWDHRVRILWRPGRQSGWLGNRPSREGAP